MNRASNIRMDKQPALPKPWTGLGQSLARATVAMQRMSGMIAEQQARLHLILSCVDEGLVVLRKDGTVMIANPAGRDMLKSVCTCGTSSKQCTFHSALSEVASGTPRLIRECGTKDNRIRSDFRIIVSDSGEERIAVRLERIPEQDIGKHESEIKEDESPNSLTSESGKELRFPKSNTLLHRVAEAVNAGQPAFAGKIRIDESSNIRFNNVNDEQVVQMLVYLVHQIICDMNRSGIGTEIRLNACVESDEPMLWVTHDGLQTESPVVGKSTSDEKSSSPMKGHLPLFTELRAVQNGLTLKSSRTGNHQKIEIRKRSSLG
jgi:hypothetical protein